MTVFFLRALISIFLYAHTSAIHTPQLTCIVAQEFYVCKPYCAYLKTFFAHFFSNVKTIPRFLCNIHNLMRCSLRKKQLKKPYFFGQRSEKIQRYTKLSSAFCKNKPSPSHFAKKKGVSQMQNCIRCSPHGVSACRLNAAIFACYYIEKPIRTQAKTANSVPQTSLPYSFAQGLRHWRSPCMK